MAISTSPSRCTTVSRLAGTLDTRKSGKRFVPLAKERVKLKENMMTKSEAEDAGGEVIAFIKRNCDRNTKWAHDVLACTDNRKAAAVDVRAEAHKYLKETIAHHQQFIDCIHYIIDKVPEEYSHDARTRDEVENPVELPDVAAVTARDIIDYIWDAPEGMHIRGRALKVVKREVLDTPAAKLFDLKLEHWLRHQNCGRKTANFIMQTLADMRGAA
tara:strand:- start:233 stop:877 length:645 start_codon:yes stop_codon:yes gene_type:complete